MGENQHVDFAVKKKNMSRVGARLSDLTMLFFLRFFKHKTVFSSDRLFWWVDVRLIGCFGGSIFVNFQITPPPNI